MHSFGHAPKLGLVYRFKVSLSNGRSSLLMGSLAAGGGPEHRVPRPAAGRVCVPPPQHGLLLRRALPRIRPGRPDRPVAHV